jgi:hypothetical protein
MKKLNIPTIVSVIHPGIAKFGNQKYAFPGWIPINENLTLEMLNSKWIDMYANSPKFIVKTFDIKGSKTMYKVSINEQGLWNCKDQEGNDCIGFTFYKTCKHIAAAKLLLQANC